MPKLASKRGVAQNVKIVCSNNDVEMIGNGGELALGNVAAKEGLFNGPHYSHVSGAHKHLAGASRVKGRGTSGARRRN